MKTSDFDYQLPPELIAQTPIESRDQSRLMVLHRNNSTTEHRRFYDIMDYLQDGDTMVFNNSRVIPARIMGEKGDGHTKVEIMLLKNLGENLWEALVRPGKKIINGTRIIVVGGAIEAEVVEQRDNGIRVISFSDDSEIEKFGRIPLPPYIHKPLEDAERYQTVYARTKGSVAAPTAGLHFTTELLERLRNKGVQLAFITLHIGLDTFRPVRVDDPSRHVIHGEFGELTPEVAALINETKDRGKKVIAVGTSSVRLLEAASQTGRVQPISGWVDLFIIPGYKFLATDVMVTNFHLPRSTLLMLVSAFAGRDFIINAYEQAKKLNYRFYSFGDAMLIL